MRRGLLLLGAFGVFGPVGCAAWRQPVPTVPVEHTSTVSSSTVSTTAVVIPQDPRPLQPSLARALPRTDAPGATPPVVPASATLAAVQREPVVTHTSAPPAEPAPDALTLVAEALDRNDKAAAAGHLEGYVRQHPDEAMFRLQLAELLVQTNKDANAKPHYEKFLAAAQLANGPLRDYLVHVHTRLMEIAERGDDTFSEVLHRGAGLLILVQEQDKNPNRDDTFCEEMLCKALRAFNEAKEQKPDDPRLRVYLAEVYERMGNRRGAKNERSGARNTMMPGELTPAERASILVK
jgi:hypothetical protein